MRQNKDDLAKLHRIRKYNYSGLRSKHASYVAQLIGTHKDDVADLNRRSEGSRESRPSAAAGEQPPLAAHRGARLIWHAICCWLSTPRERYRLEHLLPYKAASSLAHSAVDAYSRPSDAVNDVSEAVSTGDAITYWLHRTPVSDSTAACRRPATPRQDSDSDGHSGGWPSDGKTCAEAHVNGSKATGGRSRPVGTEPLFTSDGSPVADESPGMLDIKVP